METPETIQALIQSIDVSSLATIVLAAIGAGSGVAITILGIRKGYGWFMGLIKRA